MRGVSRHVRPTPLWLLVLAAVVESWHVPALIARTPSNDLQGSIVYMSGTADGGAQTTQRAIKAGPLKQESVLLSTGVCMETLSQQPASRSEKRSKPLPPLLFVHGSYHAAWCWAEHWMPFLAARGYDTHAISLRGTSGSPLPEIEGKKTPRSVKVAEHVADIEGFISQVLPGRKPVVIAHSFGGLVLMKAMEAMATRQEEEGSGSDHTRPALAGAVFLCSVPPSGNGPMTGRFIKEKPVAALKIVLGFVFKMAVSWPWLAKDLFFTQSLDKAALHRYMQNYRADSKVGLDLGDLRRQLPSKRADAEGRADWLHLAPPRMVAGGERDYIVDSMGVAETAEFLGVDPIVLPNVPHGLMLGDWWPRGVDRL